MRARALAALLVPLAASIGCDAVAENREPWCRPVPATTLAAASVPSASLVPCVRRLPDGWRFAGFAASDAGSTFAIEGPEGSAGRADVTFTASCRSGEGDEVRSDEPGTTLREEVHRRDPYAAHWTYRFDGGCTHVDVALGPAPDAGPPAEGLAAALSFVPRQQISAAT